jgi:predicted transcriptional regulator
VRKQVFSVRLPEEVLQAIEKISTKEDRPRGAVIRRLLIRGLKTKEEKMEMENEWEIRAVALLSRLPDEDEAEIVLTGGRERSTRLNLDLAGLLRGTPMESWTSPGNEEFLREVIRHARVLLQDGKINTYFAPDEEIK